MMEVIKYALVPLTWGISSLVVVLELLSLLINKLRKKDIHKTKKKLIVAVLCTIITFVIMCTYDLNEEEADIVQQEMMTAEEVVTSTVPSQERIDVSEFGTSAENPIVITAEDLAVEIESDIDEAKVKFNGKWVKITGVITDTSDGGVVYGYYLYGKKATSGYNGLRIMCWCEDGPYSGSVLGDTQTFLGQILEVTNVNVTEIVDCIRVIE